MKTDTAQSRLFEQPDPFLGDVEAWCVEQGFSAVVGVDEAGRGPLAGPVYAAAVVLDLDDLQGEWIELLDDSKKLKPEQRAHAAEAIRDNAIAYSIAHRCNETIDDINILQATLRAMEEAIEDVCSQLDAVPDRVFIDGNTPVNTALPQQPLVGGDGRSYHIAAASILAKVARDTLMLELHEKWPEYNFASNKGYGTQEHRRAIAEVGPCHIHRLSFGGVREFTAKLRA